MNDRDVTSALPASARYLLLPPPSEQPLTMGSREIADLLDSRHDSVKRAIERLAERAVIELPPLVEANFKRSNGRTQRGSEYHVGKRDSYVIVAQLSPEFAARLVDRWQELEARAVVPALSSLPDFTDPAAAARAWADQVEQLGRAEAIIRQQRLKVSALDQLGAADGSMCITDTAKAIGVAPRALFSWLERNAWTYRRNGGQPIAYQAAIVRGMLEYRTRTIKSGDGRDKLVADVRVTPKGLAELARHAAGGAISRAGRDR